MTTRHSESWFVFRAPLQRRVGVWDPAFEWRPGARSRLTLHSCFQLLYQKYRREQKQAAPPDNDRTSAFSQTCCNDDSGSKRLHKRLNGPPSCITYQRSTTTSGEPPWYPRPVKPILGPPITKRPVGLMEFCLFISKLELLLLITLLIIIGISLRLLDRAELKPFDCIHTYWIISSW